MLTHLKDWLVDFPTHGASSAVAVLLILLTGLVVIVRLAVGWPFPEGYGDWLILLGALTGVSTIGMIGKRLSSVDYKAASVPAPQVNVESANTVTTTEKPE